MTKNISIVLDTLLFIKQPNAVPEKWITQKDGQRALPGLGSDVWPAGENFFALGSSHNWASQSTAMFVNFPSKSHSHSPASLYKLSYNLIEYSSQHWHLANSDTQFNTPSMVCEIFHDMAWWDSEDPFFISPSPLCVSQLEPLPSCYNCLCIWFSLLPLDYVGYATPTK